MQSLSLLVEMAFVQFSKKRGGMIPYRLDKVLDFYNFMMIP